MLLANQRLPEGKQILAGIMSLSKSILGKSDVKEKIAQNNSQVSKERMTGITVKPGQDSIHELII